MKEFYASGSSRWHRCVQTKLLKCNETEIFLGMQVYGSQYNDFSVRVVVMMTTAMTMTICHLIAFSSYFQYQKDQQQRRPQLPGKQVVVVLMKMVKIFWQEWVLEVRCVVLQAANPNPNWMTYLVKMHLPVKVRIIIDILHNLNKYSCCYFI